jgi:Cu2+-exporting ATPase
VARCGPSADIDASRCLAIAAALEEASEHPLARAFGRFRGDAPAGCVSIVAGSGVEGVVSEKRYRIGSREFVAALRRQAAPLAAPSAGGTIVYLGDAEREIAWFELRDEVRESAGAAAEALRDLGVAPQILSGDDEGAVASVAAQCGVSERFSRCTPQRKLIHVQSLQRQGRRVAMIGDGVNDAPVLGVADVSIAMGRGAALAHTTADLILVREDLQALPNAVVTARRTLRIARQNLRWSAAYNLGSLPLAAFGLIPPWLAALGMSLSSIAVVVNALRLLPQRSARAHHRPQEDKLAAGGRRLDAEEIPSKSRAWRALPSVSSLQPPAEDAAR